MKEIVPRNLHLKNAVCFIDTNSNLSHNAKDDDYED